MHELFMDLESDFNLFMCKYVDNFSLQNLLIDIYIYICFYLSIY